MCCRLFLVLGLAGMISRLRVLGLDVSDGRAAFRRAKPARQKGALPTKADGRVVYTRARRLDDRLVSCIGLDRLPVGQAPHVLEKTLLACSVGAIESRVIATGRNQWLHTSWHQRGNANVSDHWGIATSKCSCIRCADVAARSAGAKKSTIPMGGRWQARNRRGAVQSNCEPYR